MSCAPWRGSRERPWFGAPCHFGDSVARHYIGIDLGCTAAGKGRNSAVAIVGADGKMQGDPTHFSRVAELVEAMSHFDRAEIIVAVDAPRSVPDWTIENYAYRSCEKAIKAVDPHAGSFVGGAALFIRWYEIEERYFRDVKVIETYPRVVWKRLELRGKPKDFSKHRQAVWEAVGKLVGASCQGFTHHQVDAVLCAYTAWCYGNGRADGFGNPGEGLLFIPALGKGQPVSPEDERIDERFRRFPCMVH